MIGLKKDDENKEGPVKAEVTSAMVGLKKDDNEASEATIGMKIETNVTAAELKEQIEDGIKQEQKQEKKQVIIPPIGPREIRALNDNRYEKISKNFDRIFLIQNKRTQQIVELRAASSFHACTLIGWRPRHVKVIEEKSISKEVKPSSVEEIVRDQVDNFQDAISTASSSKATPADMLSG